MSTVALNYRTGNKKSSFWKFSASSFCITSLQTVDQEFPTCHCKFRNNLRVWHC